MLVFSLKTILQGHDVTINDFSFDWEPYENTSLAIQFYPINISGEEIESKENLPALTYIIGYCCYSINKKLKCGDCNEQIVSSSGNVDDFQITMIKGLSKGQLYPTHDAIGVVLVCYLTIKKFSESDNFYRSSLPKLAITTCLAVFDGELRMNSGLANFCGTHDCSELVKMILWASTNILLNNLCFKKNDEVRIKRFSKRCKLNMLT